MTTIVGITSHPRSMWRWCLLTWSLFCLQLLCYSPPTTPTSLCKEKMFRQIWSRASLGKKLVLHFSNMQKYKICRLVKSVNVLVCSAFGNVFFPVKLMKHIFAISTQVVLGCSQALLDDEVSCASVCQWTGPPPLSCSLVASLQDHHEVNGSFRRTEADEGNGNSSVSFQRGDIESEEENSCSVGLTALYEDRCSFEKDVNRETSDGDDRRKKRESHSQKSKVREKSFKKCCCTLTITKAGKNTKLKSSVKTHQNIDRKGSCWRLALSIQRKLLKSDFGILWKRISVFCEAWLWYFGKQEFMKPKARCIYRWLLSKLRLLPSAFPPGGPWNVAKQQLV